jgi:cell pole-organizing protein PopZ
MTNPATDDTLPDNPSMEDILSAIRGIISEEQGVKTKAESEKTEEENVLELCNIIQDDGSIIHIKELEKKIEEGKLDVLQQIDNALASELSTELSADELNAHAEIHADIPAHVLEPETMQTEEMSAMKQDELDAMMQSLMASDNTQKPSMDPVVDKEAATSESDLHMLTETAAESATETSIEVEPDIQPVKNAVAPSVAAISSENHVNHEDQVSAVPQESQKNSLLSDSSLSASRDAIRSLFTNMHKTADGPGFRSGLTLEDLVVELLKPELSSWLNQHLPGLVKQIVEKEIKKLIPHDES